MLPSTITMHFHILLIFTLLPFGYGVDRKITYELNPHCKNCSSDTTLLYVRADGTNDTIHQIWDFTLGIPTMIFAVASLQSLLSITWRGTEPVAFSINEYPTYSFAAAIDKIYEYDDLLDDGYIDKRYPKYAHRLREVRWNRTDSQLANKEVMLKMTSVHWDLGIIEMRLDLLPFVDYGPELPHLIHTANSTLVDISLVNLTSSQHYNATRFAVHFLLASTDEPTETMHYVMRKSLDDEHTPGVFEIIEIKTPSAYHGSCGGFLQFHPVGYTQRERGVAASTLARVSNFEGTELPEHSTMWRFFRPLAPKLTQDMFVSFGETGDGYYKQHNFTSWSFTIGYGVPPQEKFSLFVIMIITIGLGVPIVLALSGIVYVLVRRHKQRNARTRFTNED